jgi:cytochrome c2
VLSLVISAALYAVGARRSRGVSRRTMVLYWSGMIALALAPVSPLHELGEAHFSAHMAQHEVLMLIAAPLLVLSRPLVPMLWAYTSTTAACGLTPLEDQQIGGLIMWVPAGLIYLIAGLWLFALWIKQSDMRSSLLIHSSVLLLLIGSTVACSQDSERTAAILTGGDPHRGAAAISGYGCGTCHTIPGIADAHGLVGPPLAGIRHRTYVAGMLDNTPQNLVQWIQHPKAVNARTAMPDLGMNTKDAYDIAAYLYTDR